MTKHLLMAAASLFVCGQAMATKARVLSLQGANHIADSQTIFVNPAHLNFLGQYLTLEFGPTAQGATTPKAEGGLFKKSGDATMGLYLGHHDASQAGLRGMTVGTLAAFEQQSNPVEFFYGKDDWAFSVGLSNTDNKTNKVKETTLIGRFGVSNSNISWWVGGQVLSNATQDVAGTEAKYTGAPYLNAGVYKMINEMSYQGVLDYGNVEVDTGATKVKTKDMNITLSALDHSLKADNRDIYYGISLEYLNRETGDPAEKINIMRLPIVAGLEVEINSWAWLRGSVKQNFLLGSIKDETAVTAPATAETDTIANNTVVTGGLGFKYNNISLDGTLAAASTGDINGNQFLATAGMIYNW